jgi:hypothetical protein
MKTTDTESVAIVAEDTKAVAVAIVAEEAAPEAVTSRVDEAVWFVAHLVSVALMTAAGAVVALFAIMVLVLFAPVFLVLFAVALRRHDVARLRTASA